ncbi:MAG: response regulator [Planctomycetota bacterium]
MDEQRHKILLVEPDPEIVEILVASISKRLDAQITCVADTESCLDVDMVDPHHLVICELELDDGNGVELAEKLRMLSARPIILLADDPTTEDTLAAMRLGIRDLLIKPFPVTDLLDATERALRSHEVHQAHAAKYHRMRKLVRRVLRERRELNQRVELVCRDLVGAQRRLMHRVVESQEARPTGQT